MIRVQIIQPVVLEYRVAFFNTLACLDGLQIQVYASKRLPYADLKSVSKFEDFIHLNHPCIGFIGNRLLWQKRLRISEDLRSGDVLVVSGNPRFLSNFPLILKAKRRNIGVVWWGHGWSAGSSQITATIRRSIMRWMDVILLYTDKEVEEYKQRGFSPDKLFATNNTIDQKPIQKAMLAWSASRLDKFKIQNNLLDKRILLFCSRLTAKSGLDLMLYALARLSKIESNYLLVVIGEGKEKQRLMKHAEILGISGYVQWVGSIFDQMQIAPWFMSAECLVYPGAIGLSLIHAFSYGLPVITHGNMLNQGPEIAALQNGENGLLFSEGNVDDLVKKILFLTEHPDIRSKMSKQALNTVANKFSMDNMVKQFVNAIYAAAQKSN